MHRFVNMILHHCHLCWFINHNVIKPANKSNYHSSHYWPFSFADSRTLPYVEVASVIYVSLFFMFSVIFYKSISFFLEVGLEEWVSVFWLKHGQEIRYVTKLLSPCHTKGTREMVAEDLVKCITSTILRDGSVVLSRLPHSNQQSCACVCN